MSIRTKRLLQPSVSIAWCTFPLFLVANDTAKAQAAFDPANPAGSGYQLVFSDEFDSPSTIDLNYTATPGYKWYPELFLDSPSTPPSVIRVENGALTLLTDTSGYGGVQTAMPANNEQGWIGRAFGGGAYFEARLKFDPATISTTARSWPSFWSIAIEFLARKGAAQWLGQVPGYVHYAENDFFEYNLKKWYGVNTYGGAIHDWYGTWNQCGNQWYCEVNNSYGGGSSFTNYVITVPASTDWTQYHTVGQLWVPGTSANGNKGYVQYYFDDQPTSDKVTWVNSGDGTPPPTEEFAFSIMDKQHLVIVLGTGVNVPMSVDWVHVWQIPGQGTCIGTDCNIETSAPDTTPPSVPTNLFGTAISPSQINLSWGASTDNVGVTGYKVYRNRTQVGTALGISYSDSGLATATTYSYTVAAYDAAGNTSAQSVSVSIKTQSAINPVFGIGVRVKTTSNLNIRDKAGNSGKVLGTQPTGALGTIIGGPTKTSSSTWWNVNFDTGKDGWISQDYLTTSIAVDAPR